MLNVPVHDFNLKQSKKPCDGCAPSVRVGPGGCRRRVDPLGWAVFSTFTLLILCSVFCSETSSSVSETSHWTHPDLWHKAPTEKVLNPRFFLHCWQQESRDELWKQLRQLACFLSCSGHLQLHYMLTCCNWHCATRLWFTGTEPWTRVAGLSSAPGLSATSSDLQKPPALQNVSILTGHLSSHAVVRACHFVSGLHF